MRKTEINFVLPFPVSVNQYYRSIPRGKFCSVILSLAGRKFKARVANLIEDSERQPTDKPVIVMIKLYPPTKRKYDVDNMLKSLLDSLIGIAYVDDSQIHCLAVSKEEVFKGGKCEIKIKEV